MRPALPNPAWSNCALLRFWDAIEYHVGPSAMPKVTKHAVDALEAIEYGHGSYGVVMPTQGARGAVCKITTDPSEAHFVAVYHALRKRPDGIVKYGPVFSLPAARKRQQMFVLWREEAFDVGKVFGQSEEDRAAQAILNAFFDETQATCKVACSVQTPRRTLERVRSSASGYRGRTGYEDGQHPGLLARVGGIFRSAESKAGYGEASAEVLAKELTSLTKFRAIGRALLDLIKQGVLVTDVHSGNFGYVKRGGRRLAVVTDPGNVAFLSTRFDREQPKSIMDGLPRSVREKAEETARRAGCAR